MEMEVYLSAANKWDFLLPWTDVLQAHYLRVKTKPVSDHTHRPTFDAIEVVLYRHIYMDDDDEGLESLQLVAEAVELVAKALALAPEAWTVLLIDHCDCGHEFDPALFDIKELQPRFELNFTKYRGELLMFGTGQQFVEILLNSSARSGAFAEAMRQLDSMESSERAHSVAQVPIKIDAPMWNEVGTMLDSHVRFAQNLQAIQYHYDQSPAPPWCCVETIVFDITGPPLTNDIAAGCVQLAVGAPFVQFTRLSIDPKQIDIAQHTLALVLAFLVWKFPGIHFDVGEFCSGHAHQEQGYFDADGSDSSSDTKIALVMAAFAQVPFSIKSINIGQMMTRAPQERDRRQVVWGHLFGTLLHPTAECTIENLSLSCDRILQVESDALLIQNAAALTPGYKTPRSLTMKLANANTASLNALITALSSGLHHVCIADSQKSIEPATVSLIVRACSRLTSLALDNVWLQSMDVFYADPAACRLTTLALSNVDMAYHASGLEAFLTQLADPQSWLGSSLREFAFRRFPELLDDAWERFLLSRGQLHLAKRVLQRNSRVHTVQLDVCDYIPECDVRSLQSEHRKPATLRSQLAFLSTTTHCTDTSARSLVSCEAAQLVLEYADRHTPRWVRIGMQGSIS